ncbi:hypothetical protein L1987_79441 [Smallanthus sonchifolius]|uniref:Uncharacterized protein n=1 Tax=Smallanthus sonchifolius TaxID=185202 RepID=A0ACB8ZEH7_9ASTR|nr:hypothetical protein L1987_79441 [Smallanthus sonchifolius]
MKLQSRLSLVVAKSGGHNDDAWLWRRRELGSRFNNQSIFLYVHLTYKTTPKNPNMKMRNKGKVHPSSSSTPAHSPAGDSLSVLTLLPAAILSLAVALSVEDREVLAYMITRSIKSSNPNNNRKKGVNTHKPPVFDCDCFDCYTSYWFKWDTSVNRELIHQAIEAFEETLTTTEQLKKKGKKKDKTSHRRLAGKSLTPPPETIHDVVLAEAKEEECSSPFPVEEDGGLNVAEEEQPLESTTVEIKFPTASQQHKGAGRKVLPDVIGLFNWRIWGIWGPNVE